jgi:trans-aconitate 2-methyltransferase
MEHELRKVGTSAMVWDPQQYLKFSGHRLRPAVDLLMRIPDFDVRGVADLGAGAGNVSKLLKERWPEATVTGVEGSAEMVAAGRVAAAGFRVVAARADI